MSDTLALLPKNPYENGLQFSFLAISIAFFTDYMKRTCDFAYDDLRSIWFIDTFNLCSTPSFHLYDGGAALYVNGKPVRSRRWGGQRISADHPQTFRGTCKDTRDPKKFLNKGIFCFGMQIRFPLQDLSKTKNNERKIRKKILSRCQDPCNGKPTSLKNACNVFNSSKFIQGVNWYTQLFYREIFGKSEY